MEKHTIKEAEESAKLQRWAAEVKEFQESGMTIKSFCEMKGMHHSTYYRHLRTVQGAFLDSVKNKQTKLSKPVAKPVFAKVCFEPEENKIPSTEQYHGDSRQNIYIHINSASIEVRENSSFEFIEKVLAVVKSL